MDLYTLDETFLRSSVVEETNSVIWVDRYSSAGEVTVVVPASGATIEQLAEGTFLSLDGSKEVMLLETQSIKDDLLTVTGPSLLKFLDERFIRFSPGHDVRYWPLSGFPPLQVLTEIVNDMCVVGSPWLDADTMVNVDAARAAIPNLSTITGVESGVIGINVAVPFGPVYEVLKTIAETYRLGHKLYLDDAGIGSYSLIYESYVGRDLTSSQTIYPTVRFSPGQDSLTDVKELRSISGYKNVAYSYAPALSEVSLDAGVAFADSSAATSVGFDRRVLMVFADDITTDEIGGDPVLLKEILGRRAQDALANHNFVKMVDGEIVPQNDYQFGVDYMLGDIIEIQGLSGALQNARVTEYIRSQDAQGEKAYPTISIVNPPASIETD